MHGLILGDDTGTSHVLEIVAFLPTETEWAHPDVGALQGIKWDNIVPRRLSTEKTINCFTQFFLGWSSIMFLHD